MSNPKRGIGAGLVADEVALSTALTNAELQAVLAAVGYEIEQLQQGDALRQRAQALRQQQVVAHAAMVDATKALVAAQTAAHAAYRRHATLARVMLKSDAGARTRLGLMAPLPHHRAGWLEKTRQFYATALAEAPLMDLFARYKVTPAQLEAARQQVEAVAACMTAQRSAKSAALAAIRERDAAVAAFAAWMQDFRRILRMELKDRPDLLQQVGIAVRTQRRRPALEEETPSGAAGAVDRAHAARPGAPGMPKVADHALPGRDPLEAGVLVPVAGNGASDTGR